MRELLYQIAQGMFENYIQYLTLMNFLKKVLGLESDLKDQLEEFQTQGTFFEVIKETRNVKLKVCQIRFVTEYDLKYVIQFTAKDNSKQTYELPIHLNMSPVNFAINKAGKMFSCFQWQIEEQNDHVGCYMAVEAKQQFKDILCKILKLIAKDENIKDHLSFCKELAGIPIYKSTKQSNISVSSGIASESKELLNNVLIAEAQKAENKMVHTCSYYLVEKRERQLVQQNLVFVLKCYPGFRFQFNLVNLTGFSILKKEVDPSLNYQINVDKGYIRWINVEQDCKIIEVNFDGKRDAALSLKYNMLQCMYELKEKKKIQDNVPADEIQYMKKISEDPYCKDQKVVKVYEEQKGMIQYIYEKSFIYEDEENKKGLAKYKSFCQAKIGNFSIAALGSMLETLNISEDGHIKLSDKKRLFDRHSNEVDIGEIFLHDNDTKGMIRGEDGKLYYQDLVKGKLIEEFNPSPKKGIVGICPEFKQADATNFKTFKAISENAIYEIDPRTKEGVGSLKDYATTPFFNTLSVTQKGSFAIGSSKGEIRFYNQIGKNASNKFTANGDTVIHLDSTKDGKWCLATFKKYLRLIPTENEDGVSLYDKRMPFNDRPTPVKLEITLEDIQKYNIKDYSFVAAKFDESKESIEKFIVSGFGEYTILWNLGCAIRGDRSYILTKNQGRLVQADFKYNDPNKLIMTMSNGIIIKENRIKK